MPNAWYLCPYRQRSARQRYCAMDDFTAQIRADGGAWAESEVLGNCAIVKVRASVATLQAINAEPGFDRLPRDLLDDPLSSLSPAQRQGLRNRLNQLGYPFAEIQAAVGDLSTVTLGDVLRFAARRRLKPWFDKKAGAVSFHKPFQKPRPIQELDEAVI